MINIYDQLNQLRDKNVPTALVTVIATKGSTPRETGAKMIVCGGKVFGTIGGSAVEAMVIDEARECLKNNETKKVWHDLDDQEKEQEVDEKSYDGNDGEIKGPLS